MTKQKKTRKELVVVHEARPIKLILPSQKMRMKQSPRKRTTQPSPKKTEQKKASSPPKKQTTLMKASAENVQSPRKRTRTNEEEEEHKDEQGPTKRITRSVTVTQQERSPLKMNKEFKGKGLSPVKISKVQKKNKIHIQKKRKEEVEEEEGEEEDKEGEHEEEEDYEEKEDDDEREEEEELQKQTTKGAHPKSMYGFESICDNMCVRRGISCLYVLEDMVICDRRPICELVDMVITHNLPICVPLYIDQNLKLETHAGLVKRLKRFQGLRKLDRK